MMIPGVLPEAGIAIRVMTSLVFASAAVGKMTHWLAFEGVVANYRLLPESAVRPIARVLPPLELALGLGLLVGRPRTPVFESVAGVLLVLFAAAMAVNLLRGRRYIECGCFQSAMRQTLRWALVIRNCVLALLCVALLPLRMHADLWSVGNGLLGGGALFVVLQCLNTLWAIVPAVRPTRATLPTHSEAKA